ncbi:MAG: DUF1295 domain-containing protein [Pseudomonadota bacterium]
MSEMWLIFGLPLFAAVLGFVALWPFSLKWRDVSIVDAIWGPGFFGQLCVVLWLSPSIGLHGWIVFGLVAVWSLRLSLVLIRRRVREGAEDARYQSIRASWGPSFWWKSLFIVFILQAVIQWAIVLGPIALLVSDPVTFSAIAWLGVVVAALGLGLESLADQELDRFKATAEHGDLCTGGLRAHVRHPNYTGEIVFWCGIAIIAVDAGAWLGLISPILLTLFLTRISGAPLLDERLQATRPAYPAYRARVPGFIPLLRPRTGQQLSGQ